MLPRWLTRGGVTVGIASALVIALPVTTANALVLPSPKTAGQMVIGAVRAGAPGAAKVAVTLPGRANPLGMAFTAGQLLYMTRDSWMPWVEGHFGEGGAQSTASTGNAWLLYDAPLVNLAPGGALTVKVIDSRTTGVGMAIYATHWMSCKSAAGTYGAQFAAYTGSWATAKQTSKVFTYQCPDSGTVSSFTTVAIDTPIRSTGNQVSWGTAFDAQTEAQYQVSVDCRLANGTLATITRTTESPQGGGLAVGSCEQAFPGSHGIGIEIKAGRIGGPLESQWRQDWNETSTLYPNCVGAGVACSYVLQYLGIACVVGQAACINWALKSQANPQDYQCKFGAYSLSLSGCGILERVYEPNGTTLTDANTDGNPSTYDVTTLNGDPIAEPQPQPEPLPLPEPLPGAPGGAPLPIDPTTPIPGPVGVPTTAGNCFKAAISWNPVDWVLVPIQCGLSWAFVPTTSLTDVTAQAKADYERIGIASSVAAVTTAVTGMGGSSGGCAGPTMVFDVQSVHQEIQPFNACTAPMSTIAGYAYALITVTTVIGGAYTIIGLLAASFGYSRQPGQASAGPAAT